MNNIKLTGNSKLLKKTKSKINPRELALALAEATECGNGINPLKGYVVLPNFNSDSGDIDSRYGLMIINGELVVEPIQDIKDNIRNFCGNPLISATGATISGCPTSAVSLGASPFALTATVSPTGALQTGTWASSDEEVATVSSSGVVTIVGEGSITITFTSNDGGYLAGCDILVVGD